MTDATIKFIQPFTFNEIVMRVTADGRHADFLAKADGSWRELAAREEDYPFLAAVLDNSAGRIAAEFSFHHR